MIWKPTDFRCLCGVFFNQYRRVHHLYRLGLLAETEWAGYAMEIAGFSKTPGGKLFVEGNPLPKKFADDASRFEGEPRRSDYTLGRGSLDIN